MGRAVSTCMEVSTGSAGKGFGEVIEESAGEGLGEVTLGGVTWLLRTGIMAEGLREANGARCRDGAAKGGGC